MSFVVIVISIYICTTDIRQHKIPNVSLPLLAFPLIANLAMPAKENLAIALSILWVFGLVAGVGMGDIKLLTLLLVTQGLHLLDLRYLIGLSLISLISISFARFKGGTFRVEIPLAPAILIPFLAIYLGF